MYYRPDIFRGYYGKKKFGFKRTCKFCHADIEHQDKEDTMCKECADVYWEMMNEN